MNPPIPKTGRGNAVSRLIFGCGYLGRRVARRWLAQGHTLAAITRRPERAQELAADGICPIIADVTQPETLTDLPDADTVLFAVGFDRAAGRAISEVYVAGLANVLGALGPQVRRLIYVSSTGVYGQTDGSWVSEDSPCQPQRAGGRACLAAEERLASDEMAQRSVVLRCAGLYGPGRIPRIDDVRRNIPIAAAPDVHLNLIHIEDAAAIVCAAADHDSPSQIYLVSDGQPVLRREFYAEISRHLRLPPPTFTPPDDADERRAGGDNKRVDSQRMMRELNVKLKFADYREGLSSILAQQECN